MRSAWFEVTPRATKATPPRVRDASTTSFRLDGKVAVVTGGASGIGVGIAAVLAEAGATVVIADRDVAGAQRQAAALAGAGHRAAAVQIELADEASIVRGCGEVVA